MIQSMKWQRGVVFLVSVVAIVAIFGQQTVAQAEKETRPAKANVFIHPNKLTESDKLSDGGKTLIDLKTETSLIWVDLMPDAYFEHPTEYVLVSPAGTHVVKGRWWPVLDNKPLFRSTKSYNAVFPVKLSGRPVPQGEEEARAANANVFIQMEKLTDKDKLSDGPGRAIDLQSETTLIWVDLMPSARFAHPTEYVLISTKGTRVIKGSWWPVLNGKPLFRNAKEYKVSFPVKLTGPVDSEHRVMVPKDTQPFNVKKTDLIRLTGEVAVGGTITVKVDGPAKVENENPIFKVERGNILLGMAIKEFEIRPTGTGDVTATITVTPRQGQALATKYKFTVN